MEGAAPSLLADQTELPAHHLHELCARMARPRPVPPKRRVGGAVGLGEGREDLLALLLGDADAGVPTEKRRRASSSLREATSASTTTSPRSVNLMAFPTSSDHLAQAPGVAPAPCGGRRGRSGRPARGPSAGRTASTLMASSTVSRTSISGDRARASPPRCGRGRGCRPPDRERARARHLHGGQVAALLGVVGRWPGRGSVIP
jgi:hypothetical protein